MPVRHGVYVTEADTTVSSPIVAESAIPFIIGAAPIQSAEKPSTAEQPDICYSFAEFVEKFGYSDDWGKYNLCEFAYAYFKLFGLQPAIFVNLLNPATASMVETVAAEDKTVTAHQVKLPLEALNDTNLVVKLTGGTGEAYVKDTDYTAFYSGENLVIELISTSTHYAETSLNITYKKVKPSEVNASLVASSMDTIELCMSKVGTIPALIVAPGYSKVPATAAVMATKAAGINDLFKAKAIVDIDSSASGVTAYSSAATYKATNNLTDKNQIVCWPKAKLGDKTFYLSTQVACLIASVDAGNGNVPFESPSNKSLKIDSIVLESGAEVVLAKSHADNLNANGIVTALNFLTSGWVCWGNYNACYPSDTDVKNYFIPVSRMFQWVGNSIIKTFWSKLDKPLNRRLIDNILDTCNIWLNALVGNGHLLGARVEMLDSENPVTSLLQGIVKVHIYITPPVPMQELDFVIEYDANSATL